MTETSIRKRVNAKELEDSSRRFTKIILTVGGGCLAYILFYSYVQKYLPDYLKYALGTVALLWVFVFMWVCIGKTFRHI